MLWQETSTQSSADFVAEKRLICLSMGDMKLLTLSSSKLRVNLSVVWPMIENYVFLTFQKTTERDLVNHLCAKIQTGIAFKTRYL